MAQAWATETVAVAAGVVVVEAGVDGVDMVEVELSAGLVTAAVVEAVLDADPPEVHPAAAPSPMATTAVSPRRRVGRRSIG